MTVIVEASRVAMDFILAVGAHLGVTRKADALGLDTLHVGSRAIFTRCAGARWWWISGRTDGFFWCLAFGDPVAKKALLTLALESANGVGADGALVAWRFSFFTFDPVQALDRPVLNGNSRLVKGRGIWKNRIIPRLAYTFEL